jgi:hypothetical protein
MSGIFKQKATAGGEGAEKAPVGTHRAILVAILDLGTHTQKGFNGGPDRNVREIYFAFELADEKRNDGSNHIVSRNYNLFFNENAALRKMIEGWSGKKYEEGHEFDIAAMLNVACMVSITANKKGYPELGGVSALPKAMAKPVATYAPTLYEIGPGTYHQVRNGTLTSVPLGPGELPDLTWVPWCFGDKVEDLIRSSPEWKDAERQPAGHQPGGNTANPPATSGTVPAQPGANIGSAADEVPF